MHTLAQHEISERIYASETSVIYRANNTQTGAPVVLKFLKSDHPGNELLQSFTREYNTTTLFQSDLIIKAYSLEKYENSLVIVLEDGGFLSLGGIIDTVKKNLNWAVKIAIQLTQVLTEIHQKNIIYRDLNPTNILYKSESQTIKIIDFGEAIIDLGKGIPSTGPNILSTTLSHISPEQTGRYDKSLDYRTDLYSLGVTLYQLFTGQLPFISDDPMELIHLHLATPPEPLYNIDPNVPKTVSSIVLKLLEKSKDARYQTCAGLLVDLHRCKDELRFNKTISNFNPGEKDFSDKLLFPKTLFNRRQALTDLQDGIIEKKKDVPVVIVVSGYSGIGKTSLVTEFKQLLTLRSYSFLSGKYDLAAHNKPYAALTEILQALVHSVLVRSKESREEWKAKIVKALDGRGQLLVAILPELEIIIGKQPQIVPLNPNDAEVTLFRLCIDFIYLFAHKKKPLVIFLDDIHRADRSSLKLIQQLATSKKLKNVSFIFSLRSNEITETHPVTTTLTAIEESETEVKTIKLPPLDQKSILQLLSIVLSHPENHLTELAEICLHKTGGNPFFLRQFLYSLNSDGYLQFQRNKGGWAWDTQAVHRSKLTKNIADLLAQRIQTLPENAAILLKNAACIGKSFPLQTLVATVDWYQDAVWKLLQDLFLGKFLIVDDTSSEGNNPTRLILFSHDLIQEVAYSLLTRGEKETTHLKIGRFLQSQNDPRQKNILEFDIIYHLNRGGAHITSTVERLNLITANLNAGKRAKDAASYGPAYSFLQMGLSLLPENNWETCYKLSLELHTETSEVSYLNNKYEEQEKLFAIVCNRAKSILDKTRVYHIKARAQKAQYKLVEAVDTCEEILLQLGVRFPQSPSRLYTLAKIIQTQIFMSRWSLDDILYLPEMQNPYKREAMEFLVDMGTVVYYAKPELLPFIALTAVRLSVQHGNSIFAGIIGYNTFGLLLCGIPGGNIPKGYDYGMISLKLQQKYDHGGVSPTATYLVNNLIRHWQDHIRNTLTPLFSCIKECIETGEYEYAANAAYAYSYRLFYTGHNLHLTEQELIRYRGEIKNMDQPIALSRHNIYCQAVANLLRSGGSQDEFGGEFYDDKQMIPLHQETNDQTTLLQLFLIQSIHCYTFGQFDKALEFSDKTRKLLRAALASIFIPIHHYYDSLIRLALYQKSPWSTQAKYRLRISINQLKMKRWSKHAPQNYLHKYTIVEAELARISGNYEKAMNLYDEAIDQARTHQYLQEEALAFELASRYYTSLNKSHLAQPYMREARYCYYRWGAISKVEQLDHQKSPQTQNTRETTTSDIIPQALLAREGGSRFDMMTVIKASRILTEETSFQELLKKIIRILLESSGAQRGALAFNEKNNWVLKVFGSTETKEVDLLHNMNLDLQNIVSSSIINYVIQTGKEVMLNDASREGIFTNDQYVIGKKPRSILCSPLVHQDKMVCVLYLENNLTTRAFSPERQEILRLLGNQAAINIRNSRLFNELENTVTELHQEIQKRREVQRQLLHSEKLSALGRLSSSIAHEFGNPLIGVKYLLSDLGKRANMSKEDRELIEIGIQECTRMKKLLRDMGQLNKPTTANKSSVNIHDMMNNILKIQSKYLSAQRINTVKQYCSYMPDVWVIKDQISQVLLNLTINAVDATPDSGGELTVTTRLTENDIYLSIRDTGKGIPADIQGKIFEPFFSTKNDEDGTGLGLSTSYGIIKKHKGQLTFTSNEDKGTTFTVTLPRSANNKV